MSSDEVRLWRNEWPTSMFGPPYRGSGEIRYETCERPALSEPGVWMRAAKHAALMRVVEEAAIAVLRLEDARRNPLLAKAVSDYRALNATAPERQGEEPK